MLVKYLNLSDAPSLRNLRHVSVRVLTSGVALSRLERLLERVWHDGGEAKGGRSHRRPAGRDAVIQAQQQCVAKQRQCVANSSSISAARQ